MGDFFHGWRRKIGVMTLVTSLAFLGAWGRSLSIEDSVGISLASVVSVSWISVDGRFTCNFRTHETTWAYRQAKPFFRAIFNQEGVAVNDGYWIDPAGYVVSPSGVRLGDQVRPHLHGPKLRRVDPQPSDGLRPPPLSSDCFDVSGNKIDCISVAARDVEKPLELSSFTSYWSAILPMSFFSACLLFTKPRKQEKAATTSA